MRAALLVPRRVLQDVRCWARNVGAVGGGWEGLEDEKVIEEHYCDTFKPRIIARKLTTGIIDWSGGQHRRLGSENT